MIGIGGIGMSALAIHYHLEGEIVEGSNIEPNERVEYLKSLGVNVKVGHSSENVPKDADLIVVTRAVPPWNPELIEAKRLGIPVKMRDEDLRDVVSNLHPSIGITGTDGKTTTTAMIYHVSKDLGLNPYAFLGGIHPDLEHGNYSKGNEGVVFELDESVPTFSEYSVDHLIITNARGDHLESYGDVRKYVKSFVDLVSKTHGVVVTFADDELTGDLGKITFGVGSGDYRFLSREVKGRVQFFEFEDPKGKFWRVELRVPGFHNCLNALATIALFGSLGYPTSDIVESLRSFREVYRRFTVSFAYEERRIFVLDDYAHTPQEIENLIKTVREVFPKERIVAVFQPHRYSRTLRENGNFAKSLRGADEVYVSEIYGAFEEKMDISSRMIVEELEEMGKNATFVEDLEEFVEDLSPMENSVYLFIGAGDIIDYSAKFVEKLKGVKVK